MPKILHAALSSEAEEENISLNTYIITLLAERHIENKLLNKIGAFDNLTETKSSKEITALDNILPTAYEVEESKKKYTTKKQKK